MVPTKDMTPHVPISTDEIVKEILDSVRHGVSMVHIHARDEMPGLGKIRMSKSADKREKKIHE